MDQKVKYLNLSKARSLKKKICQNLFESIRKTGLFIHADFWLSENIVSHLKKPEDVHFKSSRLTLQTAVSL